MVGRPGDIRPRGENGGVGQGMGGRIECDGWLGRGLSCQECGVRVLLGPPPEGSFDEDEQRALDVLAESGLVPPLRMVVPLSGPEIESA